jgi:hypothetical protein
MRYIQKMPGGSQPILVQASDGLLYVVKFSNNPQGVNLLFNESIGTELYRACNLPVPSWKLLSVADSFLDENPDSWMETPEGPIRPNAGFCFGSRFLGGDGLRPLGVLPKTRFNKVRDRKIFWLAWILDICAGHADNRQTIFAEDGTGWLDPFFVDNGHLFGGPKGDQHPKCEASRYLDPRIYPAISSHQLLCYQRTLGRLEPDQLWRNLQALPDDWKTESALYRFAQCLGKLSTTSILRDVVDMVVDVQLKASKRDDTNWQGRRKPPASVPRSDFQAGMIGHCFLVKGSGRAACA